jgi:hypothetical protein
MDFKMRLWDQWSSGERWAIFGVLVLLTFVTAWLTSIGLIDPKVDLKELELSGLRGTTADLLARWDKAGRVPAIVRSTYYDFLFIPCYTLLTLYLCAGAMAGFSGNLGAGHWTVTVGNGLLWAIVLAGLCDVVENIGMLRFIPAKGEGPWPLVAGVASGIKWVIVYFAVAYDLAGLFAGANRG